MPRKRIYASKTERQRIWRTVKKIHNSPLSEHAIKQGEAEARLIAAKLTERGIAATVEQRGDVWIVRKEGSE